jgi:hypothetical protein
MGNPTNYRKPWIVGADGALVPAAPTTPSAMDKFMAEDPVVQLVTGGWNSSPGAVAAYGGGAIGVIALGAFLGARKRGGVKGGVVGGLVGAAVSTLAIELIGRYGLPGR